MLRIITFLAYWTLPRHEFERRARRFDCGYGFRFLGRDWCKPPVHDFSGIR